MTELEKLALENTILQISRRIDVYTEPTEEDRINLLRLCKKALNILNGTLDQEEDKSKNKDSPFPDIIIDFR